MRPATNASSMVRKSKNKGAPADAAEASAASKPEALKSTSSRRAASPSRPPAKADAGRQSSMQEVLKRQRRVKDHKEEAVVIESEEEGAATSSRRELLTPKSHSRPASKMASPMPDASSPEEPTPKRSRITTKTSKKTVEQIYQKKTQLEHILLRPDSYVGSVERQQLELWTLPGGSSSSGSAPRMVRRKVDYVPALYKIFDEILVNAADNLIRDPSMNTIKVDINKKQSRISIWNNGRGLPVQVHKEHRCYVPTLVFGHLLTSDNYDDSEKKVVGGRNGYGAKLTNIYSKRFIVETADSGSRSKYRQQWGNNMRQADEPEIVPYKGKDFTAVTFEPDLQRFGMTHLEDDIVALMERRAYDVAASTRGRCEVFLNGQCLEVDSFEDYVSLFLDPDDFRISEVCNDRWEVAIALTDGSGFRQVSFVNSICTSRGGTHVNCVAEQVVAAVMEEVAKEKGAKGTLAVKPQHVKNHLWVFVNCLVENPAFDSQTKETLTTKKERFGSTCELSEDLLQAVCSSGIVETLLEWSKALGKSELARHLNKSVMPALILGVRWLRTVCVSRECLGALGTGGHAKLLVFTVVGIQALSSRPTSQKKGADDANLSRGGAACWLHPRVMQGGGNNANNIRMGVPNMMMGMGQGMRMPMGMPMMGMPMMGMMGMPAMNPMMAMPMNPMMGMGMNAGMGAQTPSPSGQGADRSAGVSPAASTAVVPPKVDTQPIPVIPEPKVLPPGLPPGGLPPGVVHRERSRSRDAVRVPPKAEMEPEPVREPTPPREKTPPRCHLHNTKKPNTKCKFCQRWVASQSQAQPESDKADKDGSKHKEDKSKPKEEQKEDEEDYSRRTFKCSSLLKDQIFGSSYFKSLLDISDLDPLTEEIAKYADTLDVYNSGNNVHPSCFICQVYRLFTLPQSEDLDELLAVLDANPSAKVRCAAFLYVRFVVPPHKLWDKLDEHLFDDQELKYVDGDKQVTTTIREYVENLLVKDRYYNTPLPRIPVKVRQHLEKELAPLSQFRKRMAAVQRELPPKKVAGTAVEVYVDGNWLPGHIKSYVGQHKRKVSIQLDDGAVVQSHLGKVVLRDEEVSDKDKEKDKDDKEEKDEAVVDEKKEGDEEEKTKDEDHDQRKKKKDKKDDRDSSRSRSRSRSRHRSRSRSRRRRGSSPDWARYKGSMDPSEIERLREKAREEAVVGVGKAYSKRPTTVEGEMWRGSGSEGRVSMLGGSHSYSSTRSSGAKGPSDTEIRSRISREEEEEHKRRMREIYEKYGSDLGLQKRLFGIPKLEDANKAGTKQSRDCTLILTEGDSAKALAVAGLSIVGRDHYGVFPLRGKLRNVRELTEKQMMDNKEIEALMKIMAFDVSKKYTDASGLRYGSLMIMTDQDFDGSHIKGLVINFIEHWFPGLLQCEGFLREFVTPIVKVSRGDEVVTFFTVAEYEAWKRANNGGAGWACKYYKGLGTSTSAEAREYFSDLEQHELTFLASEQDAELFDMAFNARKADARKEWIGNCSSEVYVNHSQPTLSYDDFVNKELVLWAKYDVERAIPSMVDGLKPGQRKVLFGAFLKKLTNEVKVAQLSGFVAEKSAYHHGETSLQGTIIGMAQHFVGSNNVNLLQPCGQFGTRNQGGKDHAAARYIFTKLSPAARCIFPSEDDPVLEYQSEEGQRIEPRWYCPVIPLVLVNGSEGIGVGWSTSVPNYNPRDLIANVRRHLRGEPLEPLTPWYRGFRGTVAATDKPGRYETVGVVQRHGSTRIEVTELPVRKWTQDYKEWIMDQLQADDGKRATISEFREYHTDNTVHFSLAMLPDKVALAEGRGLEKFFHLKSTISTTNMHLFDASGKLKKYESPEEILQDFAKVRLEQYGKRKEYCIEKLQKEAATLTDKAKFIRLVVDGELEIADRASRKVCNDMKRFGLRTKQEIEAGVEEKPTAARNSRRLRVVIDVTDTDVDLAGPQGYDYLLKLKLWTLTEERLEALQRQLASKRQELEDLKATSLEQLWEMDLVRLEAALDVVEAEERKEQQEAARLMKKAGYFEDDASVNRQCVLVVSDGFSQIKRIRTDKWKAVRCGGAGKSIAGHKKKKAKDAPASGDEGEEEEMEADGDEELPDAISAAFVCREFDALLAFTRKGYVFRMQALDVPLMHGKRPPVPIAELAPKLPEDDCIASVMAVPHGALKDQGHEFAVAVSSHGFAKKIPLSSFRSLHGQKNWNLAFPLDEKSGDELRWVHRASAQDLLVMTAQSGYTLCFSLSGLRPTRLKAKPLPAMRLKDEKVGGCGIASVPESTRDDAAKPEKARRISGYNLFCKESGSNLVQASAAWKSLSDSEKEEWHAKARAMNGQNPGREEAPPPATTGQPRKRHVADDDDSDNEEEDERPQSSKEAEGNSALLGKLRKLVSRVTTGPEVMQQKNAKADPEDDDEEADMDDVRSNVPTEVSPQSPQASPQGRTGTVSASMQDFLEAHSVLLVSDDGFGKRVRLSDIKLSSRNKTGKRVKLQGDGHVVAVCVVPSDELPQLPPKPREAAILYKESCAKARTEAVQEAAARGQDPEPEKEEAPFESLSAKKQKPYFDQQHRDQQHFEAAQKERQVAEKTLRRLGEVLLCTSGGSVLRLPVMRVRVMKPMKRSQGRLMKVQRPDTLVSASLMSSVDDEKDGATVGEEQEQDAVQEVDEDEGEEEEEEEDDE
ncbi:top2 [Symbiodinium sp. CCMP2456]|nr:top2 [Symbiodinium sp. CCMP2456]